MVAIKYQNSPVQPVHDHARVTAANTGVPVDRRATNSDTQSHIQHGVKGSQDGGNWQAHKAAYDRYTSPEQKARDKELMAAAERHVARTWDPQSAQHAMSWLGQNHMYDPHAIEMARSMGTKEEEYEKSRGRARDAEKQAGKTPLPPVPGHPKASTLDVRQGVMPKTGERRKLNYEG